MVNLWWQKNNEKRTESQNSANVLQPGSTFSTTIPLGIPGFCHYFLQFAAAGRILSFLKAYINFSWLYRIVVEWETQLQTPHQLAQQLCRQIQESMLLPPLQSIRLAGNLFVKALQDQECPVTHRKCIWLHWLSWKTVGVKRTIISSQNLCKTILRSVVLDLCQFCTTCTFMVDAKFNQLWWKLLWRK